MCRCESDWTSVGDLSCGAIKYDQEVVSLKRSRQCNSSFVFGNVDDVVFVRRAVDVQPFFVHLRHMRQYDIKIKLL